MEVVRMQRKPWQADCVEAVLTVNSIRSLMQIYLVYCCIYISPIKELSQHFSTSIEIKFVKNLNYIEIKFVKLQHLENNRLKYHSFTKWKKINWVLGCQRRIWQNRRICWNLAESGDWSLTILNRSYKLRFPDLIRYFFFFFLASTLLRMWSLVLQVLVLWMFPSQQHILKNIKKEEGKRSAFEVRSALCSGLLFSYTENHIRTNGISTGVEMISSEERELESLSYLC